MLVMEIARKELKFLNDPFIYYSFVNPLLCKKYGIIAILDFCHFPGKDYIGNVYYEIPADPSLGKRKPTRWYDPPSGQDFKDPIPAEWESWLRMRRKEPPTEEEVAKNLAIAKLKKENAAKLEAKRLQEGGATPSIPEKGPQSFPVYDEFHTGDPEDHPNKQKKY
ncbi:hypothetical protein O3G_MSEX010726 [Manduca sexta]|uniref:NADH dehydrogenase [ubiquinone] 1 alpha subcomplex assembly factor 2 n=1 Tax=Manduca sexta TaxID=7130 RepID=A0A921ZIK9_MANSE|nr:hypothetical protein O3G_MSEX010726 [Manduca sexta]